MPAFSIGFLLLSAAPQVAPVPPGASACAEFGAEFANPNLGQTPVDLCTYPLPGASGDDGPVVVGLQSGAVLRWDGRRFETLLDPTPGYHFTRVQRATWAGAPVLHAIEEPQPAANTANVWRFDGSAWTQLGSPAFLARVTQVLDLGAGPELHAGGALIGAGGLLDGRVARFDGVAWIDLGPSFLEPIEALAAFDDGAGLRLFAAGGHDTGIGAILGSSNTATWNGTSWTAAGSSNRTLRDLQLYDAGGGPELYACGWAQNASESILKRWNGSDWTPVLAIPSQGYDLDVVDFGGGPLLAIGANTATGASSCSNVSLFDGASLTYTSLSGWQAFSIAAGARGGAQVLHASGSFGVLDLAYTPRYGVFDGSTWSSIGRGLSERVRALAVHSDASGTDLIAVGALGSAGGGPALMGAGRWNGTQWSKLAPQPLYGIQVPASGPVSEPWAALSADFGAGRELLVGGHNLGGNYLVGLLRHTGNAWQTLAAHGDVHALGRFDDGGGARLAVGGAFTLAGGGPANHVYLLDTQSLALTQLGGGTDGTVGALAQFDEGGLPALFAGGSFTQAGGVATGGLARWNGTSWSALGGLLNGTVHALAIFDDGTGAALYAGGAFNSVAGLPVSNVARWNGTSWSALGSGANGLVQALAVHDDGRGAALYVGGGFTLAGGVAVTHVARWSAGGFEALPADFDAPVTSLASHDDDGDGDAELFVAGEFTDGGSISAGRIARLAGCPHYASFCASDGTLTDHTTSCPCGNSGAAGHGCAHSFSSSGALLTASGGTDPDTLVLTASEQPPSALGIYLQHDALDERVFHDGVICAGGTMIRLRQRFASGGVTQFPIAGDPLSISQRGQVTPGSGATRYYALFYRNASTTFCPPATANVTNGIRVIW